MQRSLQHVLPTGFQKVRHFGFQSPNSAVSMEAVQWLISVHNAGVFTLAAVQIGKPALPLPTAHRCPCCGGLMTRLGFVRVYSPILFDTS